MGRKTGTQKDRIRELSEKKNGKYITAEAVLSDNSKDQPEAVT